MTVHTYSEFEGEHPTDKAISGTNRTSSAMSEEAYDVMRKQTSQDRIYQAPYPGTESKQSAPGSEAAAEYLVDLFKESKTNEKANEAIKAFLDKIMLDNFTILNHKNDVLYGVHKRSPEAFAAFQEMNPHFFERFANIGLDALRDNLKR